MTPPRLLSCLLLVGALGRGYSLPSRSHGGEQLKELSRAAVHNIAETRHSRPRDPLENNGVNPDNVHLIEGDIRQRPRRPLDVAVAAGARAGAGAGAGAGFRAGTAFGRHGHRVEDFPPPHQLRHSVAIPEQTWVDRIVPYVIDTAFNATELTQISLAFTELHEGGCITFIERTFQPDFLHITGRTKGCWSDVGRQGGNQTVSISRDNSCVTKGIVMHELMHALGFWHEHTRIDRDSHINILMNNILLEHLSDFDINREARLENVTYDYYSIMHYRQDQFSKDGSLATIQVLDPTVALSEVGQRRYLSQKDKLRIQQLYNCPLRSCTYPMTIHDGSVVVKDTAVGARVLYSCIDPTYTLIGASERICRYDGTWSGSTPICYRTPIEPSYCSFEDVHICGWTQDTTDEADWTRYNSHTPSEGTGPIVDHTEQTTEGYYMYMEGTDVEQDYTARLLSPVYPAAANTSVLFWYNMHGIGMGNLTVYLKEENHQLEVLWTKSGNQSRGWNMAMLAPLNSLAPFQIVFGACRGLRDTTDIAIDDVMVGSFQEISTYAAAVIRDQKSANESHHSCTFDTGWCGWSQDDGDDFDWSRKSGSTASLYTGPRCDPTNCHNGSYVYIETSGRGRDGHVARLISPTISWAGPMCLSFHYHMYGRDVGTLGVYLHTDNSSRPVWTARGNHGNAWLFTQIPINIQMDTQVILSASKGGGYRGDVAVDNVAITSHRCLTDIKCAFERGFCGLQQDGHNDSFDWRRTRGKTMTPFTGPTADHTSGKGYFAYIEASSPRRPGDVARLLVPDLPAGPRGHCVTFYYYMYGRDVAALVVRYNGRAVWRQAGNHGRRWIHAAIPVPSTDTKLQLAVEATVGRTYFSDIAIDDFSVQDGACATTS